MENTIDISEKYLLGDLCKVVINEIKQLEFSWATTTEKKQQEIIDRVTNKVRNAVIDVVQIVAADGRPHLEAMVESVTFKDGVKCVLTINKTSAERHNLSDAVGDMILIVIPDQGRYLEGDIPKAEPNQLTIL